MFLRGDVAESEECMVPAVSLKAFEDSWVDKPSRAGDAVQLIKEATGDKVSRASMLLHKVAVDLHGEGSKSVPTDNIGPIKISDTGQIEWNNEDPDAGMFIVRAPNVKLFSGFPKGRTIDLGDGVSLNVGKTKLGWTTVSLTSKGGNGFGPGSTALLAATGYTHNTGEKFTYENDEDGNPTTFVSSRWYDWGTGPILTEGIDATVTLPSAAGSTTCWALAEDGSRMTEVPVTKDSDGKAVISIGEKYRTVWYEISVE